MSISILHTLCMKAPPSKVRRCTVPFLRSIFHCGIISRYKQISGLNLMNSQIFRVVVTTENKNNAIFYKDIWFLYGLVNIFNFIISNPFFLTVNRLSINGSSKTQGSCRSTRLSLTNRKYRRSILRSHSNPYHV